MTDQLSERMRDSYLDVVAPAPVRRNQDDEWWDEFVRSLQPAKPRFSKRLGALLLSMFIVIVAAFVAVAADV
ncbi:hypothetical protein [Agromyces humi]|uniref:hypothetical protein n=1 Tax=Agromyces humi TaxID=1766800 RepID=UPI0013598A72|nr:hypothetical protein [Agromyces humi]